MEKRSDALPCYRDFVAAKKEVPKMGIAISALLRDCERPPYLHLYDAGGPPL
jgi:hypothetical protein